MLPSMDIISGLPDPILCHVLSFLSIESVVKTSVLARRWRFLWTSVHNLRFHTKYCGSEHGDGMRFSDVVYRVLLLHNGPIDSLSIVTDGHSFIPINQYQIDAWISTAVARDVQVLELSQMDEMQVPRCCFKCNTLVELTIECCSVSAKPGAVCLPKLKKLKLRSNFYEDGESLNNLVSGCGAIENLFIENDWTFCGDNVCCYVCSPTLISLELNLIFSCFERHEHELILDIPAVQYLRIEDEVSRIISARKLSSLVSADISFSYYFNSDDERYSSEDEEENPQVDRKNISRWRDMIQFLEKLSHAKTLTFKISSSAKILNPSFSIATTKFDNLTKLRIEADWHILTELLESATKLESLDIIQVDGELKWWREPKHLPWCLLSSLKHVFISGFVGGEHELDMVRYILRHAKVLKTMEIHSDLDTDKKLDILRGISFFSRRSKKCNLTFL